MSQRKSLLPLLRPPSDNFADFCEVNATAK